SRAPSPPGLSPLSLHDALPILVEPADAHPAVPEGVQGNLKAAVFARLGLYRREEIRQACHFVRQPQTHLLRMLIEVVERDDAVADRKSTRLNSSHVKISYAVFC